MAPKAVLVGMPGSGKSTIGRRLAKALDIPLLDTDAKIVETTGRTIADLFVEGEQEFRRIEADVVRAALTEHTGIVSLGGGAITSPDVRDALSGHTVVTSGGVGRPLLAGGDPAEKFRTLMAQRVPLYREVATIRINTNRRNPGAVARQIVHRLEQGSQPQTRRRRRSTWRRLPTVLNPEPTTQAPPSPAMLARQAEARHE
jgi:shikimate kinase